VHQWHKRENEHDKASEQEFYVRSFLFPSALSGIAVGEMVIGRADICRSLMSVIAVVTAKTCVKFVHL
jgi:hypothetical protein